MSQPYSRITTVSNFKKQLATMSVQEPVMVTQNGEPLYVVQDPAQFAYQQEQLALLKLVNIAERDMSQQNTLPLAQVLSNLDNRAKQN
ncbi:MAG: hypothetical protein RL217_1553 [Pseudomonadota bacterium]